MLLQQDTGMEAKGSFIVSNTHGLHTRPSTEIVKCAMSFQADIHLSYLKKHVNAKSILDVLMLSAARGAKISIEATGEDAQEAVSTLIALAKENFNVPQ